MGEGLELWGGVECTLNRVGDSFFDQMSIAGHDERADDLDRIAALGIRRIRYPVLWERVSPADHAEPDWRWTDARLERLRTLGMEPIVGLLHHGSGPRYTSLLDPAFPAKLARYARSVAERYPWVRLYTPINEPLTTARFSGLYGHWFPHARDDRSFLTCLGHQCLGTALAMEAIREVRPDALLVQTEDLGWTSSTPSLADQAAFDNERRWLSIDLLCGRVSLHHPLRGWMIAAGFDERTLDRLAERPSPPDIIGINHYVTSNRHLDDDLTAYPSASHGGNGRMRYADVEAVRVKEAPQVTRTTLLRQAWERFGIPLAITESHISASREDQLRWLGDAWRGCLELRADGVPVLAATAWSLLGAFDWCSLVTKCDGAYEPGAFDLRARSPRPTAVARMLRSVVESGRCDHPLLSSPGWWARPTRSLYPPPPEDAAAAESDGRALLITGAHGTLGRAFARVCQRRGLPFVALGRGAVDIADAASVRRALERFRPWAVINAAGYVRVDDAEADRGRCRRENVLGPLELARACRSRQLPFVTFSSDLVFDGGRTAYVESDGTGPLNYYGRTKREAELVVRRCYPDALIVRTSAFFGPWDDANFVTSTLRSVAAGVALVAADDVSISPTYVPELVNTTLDLLIDGELGIWHLANKGAITWANFARAAAVAAGCDPALIVGRPGRSMGWAARRPRSTPLESERGDLLGSLDNALDLYVREAGTMSSMVSGSRCRIP